MSTKETVLSLLNSTEFISGQELAERCNVSRAAVNKAIASLRESGWSVEAVTNKGYRITSKPDVLEADKISKIIEENTGRKVNVFCYDSLDSTMMEAKRLTADKKLDCTLLVTDEQTAGRGRMGRPFSSPKGSGVYFSLIYSPEEGIKNPAVYTAAAAVAVCRAVKELYGAECQIKWVNDVFLGNKKICGILTEGIANFETGRIETAIVGIGINVRNCNFPEELAKTAGSIEEVLAEKESSAVPEVSRGALCAAVISNLVSIYDSTESRFKPMLGEYRSRSLLKNLTVTVNPVAGLEGETYTARVLDITDELELLVETEDGKQKKLFSGEVSLKSSSFVK